MDFGLVLGANLEPSWVPRRPKTPKNPLQDAKKKNKKIYTFLKHQKNRRGCLLFHLKVVFLGILDATGPWGTPPRPPILRGLKTSIKTIENINKNHWKSNKNHSNINKNHWKLSIKTIEKTIKTIGKTVKIIENLGYGWREALCAEPFGLIVTRG